KPSDEARHAFDQVVVEVAVQIAPQQTQQIRELQGLLASDKTDAAKVSRLLGELRLAAQSNPALEEPLLHLSAQALKATVPNTAEQVDKIMDSLSRDKRVTPDDALGLGRELRLAPLDGDKGQIATEFQGQALRKHNPQTAENTTLFATSLREGNTEGAQAAIDSLRMQNRDGGEISLMQTMEETAVLSGNLPVREGEKVEFAAGQKPDFQWFDEDKLPKKRGKKGEFQDNRGYQRLKDDVERGFDTAVDDRRQWARLEQKVELLYANNSITSDQRDAILQRMSNLKVQVEADKFVQRLADRQAELAKRGQQQDQLNWPEDKDTNPKAWDFKDLIEAEMKLQGDKPEYLLRLTSRISDKVERGVLTKEQGLNLIEQIQAKHIVAEAAQKTARDTEKQTEEARRRAERLAERETQDEYIERRSAEYANVKYDESDEALRQILDGELVQPSIVDIDLQRHIHNALSRHEATGNDGIKADLAKIRQRTAALERRGQIEPLEKQTVENVLNKLTERMQLLEQSVAKDDPRFLTNTAETTLILSPMSHITDIKLRGLVLEGIDALTNTTIKGTMKKITKRIEDLKAQPNPDLVQIQSAEEVLYHLEIRANFVEIAITQRRKNIEEFIKNNNEIAALAKVTDTKEGAPKKLEDLVLKDTETIDLIIEGWQCRSKEEYEGVIPKLLKKTLSLTGKEKDTVEQVIKLLRRQADLVGKVVSPERLRERHYEEVGLTRYDIMKLERFADIDKLLKAMNIENPKARQEAFDEYWEDTLEVLNKLLRRGTINTNMDFSSQFTAFIHEPVYQKLTELVKKTQDNYDNYRAKYKNEHHRDFKKIMVKAEGLLGTDKRKVDYGKHTVELSQALGFLYKKVQADREMREFGHNVNYIVLTRGSMEDIAKYSGRLRTSMVEYAMFGKKEYITQTAMRIYEQELMKLLHDYGWTMPSQLDHLEEMVREQIRLKYGTEATQEMLDRAITVGRGMGMVTSMIDWMAQTDAPKGNLFYVGYPADAILGDMNVGYHFLRRWRAQMELGADGRFSNHDEYARLFFTMMQKDPQFFDGWDPDKLFQYMSQYASLTRTAFRQRTEDGSDVPILQMVNLFKIGSIFYRGGWRNNAMLNHHFTAEKVLGTQKDKTLWTDYDHVLWNNVDLDKSWKNVQVAGTAALNWYIGQLDDAIKKGFLTDANG
ncbi:MAG: hypothetical protein AAB874_03770, partial [Patescibacteria group bacterium]